MAYRDRRDNQEHRIRVIKIRRIPVSVSNQSGGLIIWGKPEYRGQTVRLKGSALTPASGHSSSAGFTDHYENGHKECVVVINRVPPGTYYTDTYITGHRYEEVTISTGVVVQLDWR